MSNKPLIIIGFSLMSFALVSCSGGSDSTPAASAGSATAEIVASDGFEHGFARFIQGPEDIVIRIEAGGMPPGWHAVHLHETGDCSASDFTSTGGHINPDGKAHGLLNPGGPDAADLPNVYVHVDGMLRAEISTGRVSLNGDSNTPALLDEDGSAIIFHTAEDDHETQPIGGAGARVACGVITAE